MDYKSLRDTCIPGSRITVTAGSFNRSTLRSRSRAICKLEKMEMTDFEPDASFLLLLLLATFLFWTWPKRLNLPGPSTNAIP